MTLSEYWSVKVFGALKLPTLALLLAWSMQPKAIQSEPDMLQEPLLGGGSAPVLLLVPAGEFSMGSPTDETGRSEDEGPAIKVKIGKAFYLGRTEITVADFARFVAATGYETDAAVTGCYLWRGGNLVLERQADWLTLPGFASRPDYPAVCLSWRDAFRYTEWLSEQTGARYRLPTEAEWEYAARAGTRGARFWGAQTDRACEHANVADLSFRTMYATLPRQIHNCDDGFAQSAPVASFRANAFGLHDVLGNVWEWTCSVLSRLTTGEGERCVNFWTPGERVFRGGGWYIPPAGVRSAHRNAGGSGSQSVSIGFRVVRER